MDKSPKMGDLLVSTPTKPTGVTGGTRKCGVGESNQIFGMNGPVLRLTPSLSVVYGVTTAG